MATHLAGSPREQAPWPIWWLYEDLGSPNLGGSIATAGGVLFIGAGTDQEIRAFDSDTGEELWSHHLDHTANATPMSYRLREAGRQFVVIAAGGHAWSEAGDALVAFALPD